GDVDAAVEGRVVGVEAAQEHHLALHERGSVHHVDRGAAAAAGAGDDVVHAVAIQFGRGDVDAAPEARLVGEEAFHLVEGGGRVHRVDVDQGWPAGPGPGGEQRGGEGRRVPAFE